MDNRTKILHVSRKLTKGNSYFHCLVMLKWHTENVVLSQSSYIIPVFDYSKGWYEDNDNDE